MVLMTAEERQRVLLEFPRQQAILMFRIEKKGILAACAERLR